MPHTITGQAILMNPRVMELLTSGFGIEIIYSFVIILCSLMIYFGTKELYELSSHKGIKYFRQAFLFFAIAYFLRSSIKFIIHYFNLNALLEICTGELRLIAGLLALFIFMYFSSIAIFYLLYSVMWKKWEGDSGRIWLFHILAFAISGLVIVFRNVEVYLLMNLILLSFVVATFYISRVQNKKKKSKHNLHIIYTLLFSFWVLNIIDILVPVFFQGFQLIIYLASITLFLLMIYKVLKKTGSD